MKKALAILLVVWMIFSLVACGTNDNLRENEGSGGTSQNGEENWMDAYNMSDLKVPDSAEVIDGPSYSFTDKQIKRDTDFTEEEIAQFAQSVLDSCNAPYTTKYDADTDEYVRVDLVGAEDAKGLDEYGWKFEEEGKIYSIRINFSVGNTIRFEKYLDC